LFDKGSRRVNVVAEAVAAEAAVAQN